MLRTTNDEVSERPVEAVHAVAPEANPGLRPRPGLLVGSPANAATMETISSANMI